MALDKDQITKLEKLRGEIWVEACRRATGARSITALAKATEKIVPSSSSWRQYNGGSAYPRASSLQLLDKRYPGISDLWHIGPFGLPFWGVLKADYEACDAYLHQFLMAGNLPAGSCLAGKRIKSASLTECFLGLFQLMLPPHYWRRPKHYGIQSVVDELYAYRRVIRSKESAEDAESTATTMGTNAHPLSSELHDLAEFYYEQGMTPPWVEMDEPVDVIKEEARYEPTLNPMSVLPFPMSEDDYLSLFDEVPGVDDAISESYETSSPKSLSNVPLAVKELANTLAHQRIPDKDRYNTFDLPDLLSIRPNPFEKFCKGHLVDPAERKPRFGVRTAYRYNGLDPRCPLPLRYDTLLAVISAIFLARKRSKDKPVADFLWEGFQLAIERQFNQTIYDIVKP